MAISYDRLFHKLIDVKMSTSELRKNAQISANIITHLKKNEYISLESIEHICSALSCGVDDILEFLPQESNLEDNYD